jgi:hypothetical protein
MSKLVKMLEYMDASKYDKKKMLNSSSFVKSIGELKHRELLSSNELDGDELIQREIIESIVEGADYNKVMRDAVPVVKSKSGDSGRIVTQDQSNLFADIVPEGGQIPIHQGDYGHKNVDYKKIATRVQITEEYIEDSRWDDVELELNLAGARIENALNRYVLGVMLDGCTQTDLDVELSVDAVVNGMEDIRNEKFHPSSLLLHERGAAHLYDTAALLAPHIDLTKRGEKKSQLVGLEQHSIGFNTTEDFTGKWSSTDSANNYYAMVYDKLRYARIVIREDIDTRDIKDYKHDLTNLIAKMRVGAVVTQPKAGVRFLTN